MAVLAVHPETFLMIGASCFLLGSALFLVPLQKTKSRLYILSPEPRLVIACGDCAVDGGIYRGSYAVTDGIANVLPVDCFIPGCPPTPAGILSALMQLIESVM